MRYCLAAVVKESSGEEVGNCFLVFDDSNNSAKIFYDIGCTAEYFSESRKLRGDFEEIPEFSDPRFVIRTNDGLIFESAPMEAGDRKDLLADLVDYRYGII